MQMVLLKDLDMKNIYYTCPCGRRIKLCAYSTHSVTDIHLNYNHQMKRKDKTFKPIWTTKGILNKYPIYRAFVIMKYSKN